MLRPHLEIRDDYIKRKKVVNTTLVDSKVFYKSYKII